MFHRPAAADRTGHTGRNGPSVRGPFQGARNRTSARRCLAPAVSNLGAGGEVAVAAAPAPVMPSREQIEKLAQAYWAQRGYTDGFAEQDWLRAEQDLLKMAS